MTSLGDIKCENLTYEESRQKKSQGEVCRPMLVLWIHVDFARFAMWLTQQHAFDPLVHENIWMVKMNIMKRWVTSLDTSCNHPFTYLFKYVLPSFCQTPRTKGQWLSLTSRSVSWTHGADSAGQTLTSTLAGLALKGWLKCQWSLMLLSNHDVCL